MNYKEIAQNNLDEIMKELAEYTRMAEEIAAHALKRNGGEIADDMSVITIKIIEN